MDNDPEREKLDALAARIQQAVAKPEAGASAGGTKPLKISRIGFDFVATILASLFVGWLADRELQTAPWGILVMMFVGFAVGLMRVWQSQQSE